jgi:hypothetical protein
MLSPTVPLIAIAVNRRVSMSPAGSAGGNRKKAVSSPRTKLSPLRHAGQPGHLVLTCGHVVKIGNGRAQVHVWLPPGQPQEGLDEVVNLIALHIRAGNKASIAILIPAAAKAHGVAAISKALNQI